MYSLNVSKRALCELGGGCHVLEYKWLNLKDMVGVINPSNLDKISAPILKFCLMYLNYISFCLFSSSSIMKQGILN